MRLRVADNGEGSPVPGEKMVKHAQEKSLASKKECLVAHIYNPSMQKVEDSKFKASLTYHSKTLSLRSEGLGALKLRISPSH